MNVFSCENTYLVFAGGVEGIDNSSSSHPPGELKNATVRWCIVQHSSNLMKHIKLNLLLIITRLILAFLLCFVKGWTAYVSRNLCGRKWMHCAKCTIAWHHKSYKRIIHLLVGISIQWKPLMVNTSVRVKLEDYYNRFFSFPAFLIQITISLTFVYLLRE